MTLSGIWSAALTPVDASLQPDANRAAAYYSDLLRDGCDGLALLGTTGEAMSLSASQRIAFLEGVVNLGVPTKRVLVGTGAANLDDAVRLTRAAIDLNVAAMLIMPPFYFRDASDEGIVRYYDALFARTSPPARSVVLYHFPRMSGIAFHADLVDRLIAEFPDLIVGMKDSSNDRALQADVIARHPHMAVFPGSESSLLDALKAGAAGCISGSVCLWPQLARRVFDTRDASAMTRMRGRRAALDGLPLISAVRYLTAHARDDRAWLSPMPPLLALDDERGAALLRACGNGVDGGAT